MKLILTPFVWLMVPLAFIVLAYDIAKAYLEEKVETKIKKKNNG